MTAFELLGLMAAVHDDAGPLAPGVSAIRVRDLGAVVRAAPTVPYDPATDNGEYEQLLDLFFAQGAVFPVPPGLVFRSVDTLRSWMEQNYVGLAEGLAFISGRCEARVHVRPANFATSSDDSAAAALEAHDAIRALRHGAVATVNLPDPPPPMLVSVAFLLKANEWNAFSDAVLEQERRFSELRFEQTGPWIPHDFVRLDLGV